jgi:copper chaperone CopZ
MCRGLSAKLLTRVNNGAGIAVYDGGGMLLIWQAEVIMQTNVSRDQFALIRIDGMHCHKCEQAIQKALSREPGVNEVEVDFNSGQASVLYDRETVSIAQLMEIVNSAGYEAAGFTQPEGWNRE